MNKRLRLVRTVFVGDGSPPPLYSADRAAAAHEWSRAVEVFLKSGLIAENYVVGVGHSGGACVLYVAWTCERRLPHMFCSSLSTLAFDLRSLLFSAIILVDPHMAPPELAEAVMTQGAHLQKTMTMARNRRDIWPSRAAAYNWLSQRHPYKLWDRRALEVYTVRSTSILDCLTRNSVAVIGTCAPSAAHGKISQNCRRRYTVVHQGARGCRV